MLKEKNNYSIQKRSTYIRFSKFPEMDKKFVFILILVAILQTFSFYFSSPEYFYENLNQYFLIEDKNLELFSNIYWFGLDFILYLIIPFCFIRILFKENINEYGFNFKNFKKGLKHIIVSLTVILPVIWIATSFPDFVGSYPQLSSSKKYIDHFIIFEILLFVYMFAWEFIWRGFMLFGLKVKIGVLAVFVQMLPFVILHNGKPLLETFGAIFGAIYLGYLAYKTGSYIYGVIIHFLLIFSMDFISLLRFKTDIYGMSISSFYNLILNLFKG